MTINRKIGTMLVLAALAGSATGCAGYAGSPMVGVTYISRRPPPERVEVVSERPGAEFVWINGYWGWQGVDFAWVPGRWERPAEGRRVWVPHHWEHDRNGWYLVEGHWR